VVAQKAKYVEVFRYLDTRERLILQEEAYMLINIGLAKADVLYTGFILGL